MSENILKRYWSTYGGIKAVLKSWYFRIAIVIAIMLYPQWSSPKWWDDVLSIMPNLLGFSLGGYAMWIAIGDDSFRKLISGEDPDGKPSPYMEVNSAFVHFIVLQMLSILLALVAKAYYFQWDSDLVIVKSIKPYLLGVTLVSYFLSYLIFIYALLSAIAATFALLRVSSWYDLRQTESKKKIEKTHNFKGRKPK